MAASNVTWLNSCVNPIIYAMMNTRFRKGILKKLRNSTVETMKNHFYELSIRKYFRENYL